MTCCYNQRSMGSTPQSSMPCHLLCCTIICLSMLSGIASIRPRTLDDVITTYTNHKHPTQMQKVLVNLPKGDVYVGARNTLYLFDANLKLNSSSSIGPFLDSPKCFHPDYPCTENRTVTDNDIKVMTLFQTMRESLLLTCGTLYQGLCSLHRLDEIHRGVFVNPMNDTVAFVGSRGSTVAFFAKGFNDQVALYSAATYDDRHSVFFPVSVSSRVLHIENRTIFMSYTHKSLTEFSGVDFAMKKEYKVEYIMGFGHGDYAYFLTTQRMSVASDVYETRLARVCVNDPTFSSYTEIPLKCNYGLDMYNFATAAGLGIASIKLKQTLKLDKDPTVLYVSFIRTVPDHAKLVDRTKGSVICSFPMSTLVTSFTNATKDCFKAEPRTSLLKHVTGLDLSCTAVDGVEINDDFCGSSFNQYIAGSNSIPGGFRMHLKSYITSLAFTLQKGRAIAIAGTDLGDVVKVDMDKKKILLIKNIAEDQQDKLIQSSSAFDAQHDNIYLLTGNKVVKFPIGSCSVYLNCSSCLTTEDALNCGWCGDHCAHFEECETPDTFTKNVCAPVIFDISPKNGPTEGGTLLTIKGDNFGLSLGGEVHTKVFVTVAGVPCEIFSWKKEEIKCKTKSVNEVAWNGSVTVIVSDLSWEAGSFDMNGTAESEDTFNYLKPVLYGIYPGKGPMSGGTNITLQGYNLDIGYSRKIKIARIPCNNTRFNKSSAWCMSDSFFKESSGEREVFPKTGPIEVYIDDAVVEIENKIPAGLDFGYSLSKNFKYLPDPEIYLISPNVTTVSGTKNLTITGRYLDSVETPRMIVNVASSLIGKTIQVLSEPCWFNNHSSVSLDYRISSSTGNSMICPTPQLKSADFHAPTERAPLVTHVAFLMDGVKKLKQLQSYDRKLTQLLYYPDPEYERFGPESLEIPLDQTHLELKGKNLNLAHGIADVKVFFDNKTICPVESITSDSLSCIIPDPEALLQNVSEHFVTVSVGPLIFSLGSINFVSGNSWKTILNVVLGLLVAGVVIYIIFWVQSCIRKRRVKRKHPEYRATFSWNSVNPEENTCSAVRRQESSANDYQDLPGRRLHRQLSTAPAATPIEVCQPIPTVDDETMRLLESENILVPRNYLSLGEVIGEGHFGCVYKGELQLPNKEDRLEVAVKTLHNSWSTFEYNTEAFLQEGLMMKDFHHHNVLTLIGICFEANGSPMVIIPFMKYGDLLSYIRDENSSFTVKDLMTFAVQIAAGMKYLSEIKFVHRDLAARNCMLDDDKTVKVADFGLSRDIYERDYYSSDNKKTKLPIKWMAPECIEKGSYTTKSDVWSFGVLLWEILTRGVAPYPGVDNWDILQYIKLGRRMPQPSYCPDLLYAIMLNCWEEDPRKRPTFAELEEQVQSVITKLQRKSKQRSVGLDVTYVNYPQTMASAEQSELT